MAEVELRIPPMIYPLLEDVAAAVPREWLEELVYGRPAGGGSVGPGLVVDAAVSWHDLLPDSLSVRVEPPAQWAWEAYDLSPTDSLETPDEGSAADVAPDVAPDVGIPVLERTRESLIALGYTEVDAPIQAPWIVLLRAFAEAMFRRLDGWSVSAMPDHWQIEGS